MKTILKMLGVAACLLQWANTGAQTGEIRGYVNSDAGPTLFATVKVLQDNVLMGGGQTDETGKYSCKALNPGTYDLVILHPELMTQRINNVTVRPNQTTYVDVKMKENTLGAVEVSAKPYDYTQTGVDPDVFHTKSLSGKELMGNASFERGNIKDALTFMSSDAISGSDGQMHVRGSRSGATGFFIDGVRTMEPTTLPGLGIENISAFTGGVPAMYGDLTSGAVIITTKTYFSGMRDKQVRNAVARARKEDKTED